MKIVIAPDSFKESLDAMAVATCIEKGFSEVFPDAEYVKLPLADGGEGTVDVLLQGLDGEKQYSKVTGPMGEPVEAMWALLNEKDGSKTALIEIAAASGLDLITPDERNPLTATTVGTGETIKAALDAGVSKILLGLGGSATNDGGAGILSAMGARLLNAAGEEISPGGAALAELAEIDLTDIDPRCDKVEFIVACDVSNPLCGENGASAIFGPQKGASKTDVQDLDSALVNFADVAEKLTGIDQKSSKGFGAAGGAPMGLSLAFNIQIKAGIEMVLDTLSADEALEGANLVITGEGQMDNQTLQGKTPFGIARRAQEKNIPVIGIAGSLGKEVEELYSKMAGIFGTVRSPQPLAQVLEEADKNLTRTARNIASVLKLGSDRFSN